MRNEDQIAAKRKRLRIAHVNDIAAVGSTLARAMTALGEEATVIQPARPGARLRYPWKVAVLPLRAAALLRAAAAARFGHYDVVHLHYARFGFMGALTGRPYALHVHGTDIRGVRPGGLWGRVTAPFLRQARLVYYSTPDLEPWVRQYRADAVFLPNPIETDRFRPLAGGDPARQTRRDLLVGVRLAPIKGLPQILEVLRLLAAERPETTITIVAQGEGLDQARVAAGPNATIVPLASRADLPALLAGHRLALGQFLVGAIGNYELEALACGVPVVMRFDCQDAYRVPPPLVNVEDARAAATRIRQLLDGDPALDELAGKGPEWVGATHEATTVAARVLADYRSSGLVRER